METHDHEHIGIREISWTQFGELSQELALKVDKLFQPDCVVGVSKGGLTLASVLAGLFCVDLYPIRLSYRVRDKVVHDKPRWSVEPPDEVEGCSILLVDEIAVSGRTLIEAERALKEKGAAEIKTCTLYIHPGSYEPDFYLFSTPELVVHPWDKWVLIDGKIVLHPEYRSDSN
jgi:hypoxanthine phosphoribosyltransferase